jgi:hypothetical protein
MLANAKEITYLVKLSETLLDEADRLSQIGLLNHKRRCESNAIIKLISTFGCLTKVSTQLTCLRASAWRAG